MRRTWGVYSEVLGFAAGGTVKTGGFIKDERGLPRRYGTAEAAERAATKYRKANRGSPAVRITGDITLLEYVDPRFRQCFREPDVDEQDLAGLLRTGAAYQP